MDTIGIEKGRFHLDWISASEGEKFAGTMKMMIDQVKELGPFSWRKNKAEIG
jgi:F420-non-reducing hydrogenase iron-sulfur subunit